MAYYTTQLQKKFNEFYESYVGILRQFSPAQKQGLKTFMDKLTRLKDTLDVCTTPDEKGFYHELSEEDFNELKNSYSQCAEELETIFRENEIAKNRDTAGRKTVRDFCRQAQSIISDDSEIFSNFVPGKSLPSLVVLYEKPEYDLSNVQISSTGGNQSLRVPLTTKQKDGTETKGFFTQETVFDPVADMDKLFEDEIKAQGESAQALKSIFDDIAALPKYQDGSGPAIATEIFFRISAAAKNAADMDVRMLVDKDEIREAKERAIGNTFCQQLVSYGANAEAVKRFSENPDALSVLANIHEKLQKRSTQFFMNINYLHLKRGDNLDKRNVAMTSVADLLGVPNLIARSTSMTVVKDGKKINGTFMENAKGIDLLHPTKEQIEILKKRAYNFKKFSMTKKSRQIAAMKNQPQENNAPQKDVFMPKSKALQKIVKSNPPMPEVRMSPEENAYKDLADLQVLDYICGNVDRHAGNILYQLDNDGKLLGIQGIDNDSSFGETLYRSSNEQKRKNQLPMLKDMAYISKSMAEKVQQITPAQLRTVLFKQGLIESQIECALIRLEDLKNSIGTPDGPQILDDDKFAQMDFKATPSKNSNLLTQDINKSYIKYGLYIHTGIEKEATPLVQPTVQKEQRQMTAEKMNNIENDFKRQMDDLYKVDYWYWPSHQPFRKMRTALEKLNALTEKFGDRPFTGKALKEYEDSLRTLENCAEDYIESKRNVTNQKQYTKDRVKFAEKTFALAKRKRLEITDKFRREVEKKDIKNLDAMAKITKFNQNNAKTKMNVEFAVESIRFANEMSKQSPKKSDAAVECLKLVNKACKYLQKNKKIDSCGLSKEDWDKTKLTVTKGEEAVTAQKQKIKETSAKTVVSTK